MINGTEQFVAAQRALLDTAQNVGLKTLEGFSRLMDLNLQTLRGGVTESTAQAKSLLDAQDAAKLVEKTMTLAQPAGEKATAYAKQAYEIVSATNNEIVELLQKHVEQSQQLAADVMDSVAKSAPAGSEQVFSMARNSMNAARSAYEQAVAATKRMTEVAESNIAAAAAKANVRPATPAAKKPATV